MPLATETSGAKFGSSKPSEAVENTGCRAHSVRASSRSRAIAACPGTSPAVSIWPSNSSAAPLAHKRLQQRLRIVEQRRAPVAIARYGFDHPLLEPTDRQFRLRLREAFERGDTGRDGLGQQFASRPHFERHRSRRIMVTSDQTPELAADDERRDQRRADPHILQILNVDRRHAAKPAQRHVDVASR